MMAPPSFLLRGLAAALLLFALADSTACAYLPPAPPATHVIRSTPPPITHNHLTFPSLAISDSNLPGLPEMRSQDQQVNAAIPLGGSIRGKWRVREERGPAMSSGDGSSKTPRICTSNVVFRGFIEEPYKGIVDYDSGTCGGSGTGLRWVSKTTRVVQLSARWKVRLQPQGQKFIYKGFINAGRTVGRGGSVSAEMMGLILTGEDSNNKVVGKFTADLIKSYDSSDVKIGETTGGQAIGFEPKSLKIDGGGGGGDAMEDERGE